MNELVSELVSKPVSDAAILIPDPLAAMENQLIQGKARLAV